MRVIRTIRGWAGSSRCAEFFRRTNANVAIAAALLALPLIGLSGLAIDHVTQTLAKAKLDQASDAAALTAVKVAYQKILAGGDQDGAISDGKAAGKQVFSANVGRLYSVTIPTPDVSLDVSNGIVLTSKVSYTTTGILGFGKLFAVPSSQIGGMASVSMSLPTYINIYLLVDTSGSMSIGASSDIQQTLINKIGCAFACHDGSPVQGYKDAFTYAEAKGYQLRYDVMNKGILKFLDAVDTNDPTHKFIRASIYSFDSSLTKRADLTSSTTTLRQNLPSAPATAGDYDGATHFNESIDNVLADIGTGGSGATSTTPRKLLMIATDGVQDPNRTWTSDIPLRSKVKVVDTSFCATLAGKNVTTAFIHMPYLPMAWDWGYVATLGQPAGNGTSQTRVDLIKPALQACAGKFYAQANDITSLTNAFQNIFQTYVGMRLIN